MQITLCCYLEDLLAIFTNNPPSAFSIQKNEYAIRSTQAKLTLTFQITDILVSAGIALLFVFFGIFMFSPPLFHVDCPAYSASVFTLDEGCVGPQFVRWVGLFL